MLSTCCVDECSSRRTERIETVESSVGRLIGSGAVRWCASNVRRGSESGACDELVLLSSSTVPLYLQNERVNFLGNLNILMAPAVKHTGGLYTRSTICIGLIVSDMPCNR